MDGRRRRDERDRQNEEMERNGVGWKGREETIKSDGRGRKRLQEEMKREKMVRGDRWRL